MKRFLIKLGITSAFLLLIMWGLDYIITRSLWHSKTQMLDRYNTVYWDTTNYDMLIMGHSRGMVQYNPQILDSILNVNSYNVSCNGRAIDAQVNIFNAYCRNHTVPKIVIQNIDQLTLHMSNMYEREQYLPYIIHDKDLYKATKETERFNWSDRAIPLKRYAGYFNMIKEGLHIKNKMYNPSNEYKGYEGHEQLWDGEGFNKVDRIEFETNPQAVEMFEGYLSRCKADSIHVIFVFAPMYIGIAEKMGSDIDTMFDLFQSFADRYDYPILNYTYDSICFDTLNFYNASHLNRQGAEQFSIKLANDIKELLDSIGD